MQIDMTGGLRRGLFLAVIAASISLGVAACNDTTSTDASRDRTPPTLSLSPASGTGDTVIAFSALAKDNIGLKTIEIQVSGAVGFAFDTVFTSAVTNITLPFTLFASRAVPPGTPVIVTAIAIDGAGNSSGVDTLRLAVGNIPPPDVKVISPTSGSSAVVGKSILVTVSGKTELKVLSLGLNSTGAVVRNDSVLFSSPLRDSITMSDTIAIPANATPGVMTITPFLRDSLGQRTAGPSITITIQTAAQINSVPGVNKFCLTSQVFNNACGHSNRVEVGDTVHVEADDPSGIGQLGYEVRRVVGGPIDDSATFIASGQLTFDSHTFSMKLPYTNFPTTAFIQVFARNSNGVRAYAKLSSGADRIDTVTVVAGVTRFLPFGGQVADAIYHPGKDRIYLTNIIRNEVEVFNLADSSFKAPVIVGSRPWGLAGWPRNRTGAMGDTILVANSGGTNISYIDLDAGTSGSGQEVFRYDLPNIIAFTITTTTSGTSGLPIQVATKYDFSDRPQYLGATCIAPAGTCTDVVLTYSTTPTAGQSSPFAARNGTLRWENLTQKTSHFFFEQAMGQSAARADTLTITRFDADGVNSTVLLPYKDVNNRSTVVDINALAFRDTTFVRASGNYQRAIFGEGGSVFGSRTLVYDAERGPDPTYPFIDLGVSPPSAVSDFIANTFAEVKGVAINFDGTLTAVRADSTYILNSALRLQGVLATTITNAGFDFHPLNTGVNSFPLNTRLAFAASSEPLIEIYDTHCFQRVATFPIKAPIIGPLRAAFRNSTGELVLVGATAQGVVIVTLPNTFTTTCP
jgi:hypothetical protein